MDMVTRRRFLAMSLGAAGLAVGARAATGAPAPCFEGCFLRAATPGEYTRGFTLQSSSGDKEADQVCRQAEGDLRQVFGVAPALWFFDDGQEPNAFAAWEPRPGNGWNGTVLIGLKLVATAARRNELNRRWKLRLTAIVAHEWAHIVQYSRGRYGGPGKSGELHADFLAGWFLGRPTPPAGRDEAKNEAMYRLFFLGDTAYTDPNHHGTPLERASAVTDGFELAATVDKLDVAFEARRF